MLFYFACEAAGASAPGIPHALPWKGGNCFHTSDASRRENADVCVALGRMPIDVVIASAAKQSSFLLSVTMDCFAALAMTPTGLTCERSELDPGPIPKGSSFALRPPTQEGHARARRRSFASRRRPGHSRPCSSFERAWMAGTSPAMTIPFKRGIRISARCSLEDHPRAHSPIQFAVMPGRGGDALLRAAPLTNRRPRAGGDPVTTGSSFALRPPTQQPSCPGETTKLCFAPTSRACHVLARRTKERGWPGQARP